MLLHVLCKVGLLRVTLSTVGADVCLYMLGLLVLGDVLKERLFVGEALVAGVALVGLVSLVASRVGLQVRQLGERLGATWQGGKKGSENNFRQEIYHCGQKEACPDFLRAVNCFCRWITSIAAKSGYFTADRPATFYKKETAPRFFALLTHFLIFYNFCG